MDRVSLGGPIIEVPGLLRALSDLNERRFHRIGLFCSLDFEGIPTLLIKTNVVPVGQLRAIGIFFELDDLTVRRFDAQFASESRRNIDSVILLAGLPVQ